MNVTFGTKRQNRILAETCCTVLYRRGCVRFIENVRFTLTLAWSKAPQRWPHIVQMKVALHPTCIVGCNGTFVCVKWIFVDGDNFDTRCVVHWLFSIKPLRIGCRPQFGRALTGQTANQIGSKGFLLAKFFYDYQIGLLPSIISQNHRRCVPWQQDLKGPILKRLPKTRLAMTSLNFGWVLVY